MHNNHKNYFSFNKFFKTLTVLFGFFTIVLSKTTVNAYASTKGEAVLLGKYRHWSVYKSTDGAVFMNSTPIKHSGTFSKREDPSLMVSNFGNGEIELSVYTGYTHKADSTVSATIYFSNTDSKNVKTFAMHSKGERAWLKDHKDQDIVASMKRGLKISLSAISHKNTTSTDEYSLEGFSDALSVVSGEKAVTKNDASSN